MSSTLPVFTPIEDSLFLTLCGRALDNHRPRPILGDPMAERVVGELGYDCGRFRLSASPIINIAHRARKLDVDFPEVVAARRRLLPARADAPHHRADLTDSQAASWPSTATPGSPSGRPGTTTAPSRWPT